MFITPWLVATLVDVGFSLTAAIITTIVIETAIVYAGSRIIGRALAPNLKSSAIDRTQMMRQSTASRRIVYGQVKLSGPLALFQTSGVSNEFLHLIVLLAGHECNAISTIWLNDEVVPIVANAATGKYAGNLWVYQHLGATTQTADANLIADVPGVWDVNCKLSGICYLYVKVKFDAKLFPSGLPNFSCLTQGKKVYDPRSATTAYSTNAALCVYDYFLDTALGLGALSTEVDQATIIASANTCDEAVALLAGGTEARFTCNGTVDTSLKVGDAINTLLTAMNGFTVYAGGLWFIKASKYYTPTVTLTDDDLRGAVRLQTKVSRRELVNSVKGVYISPLNNWQASDFTPVANATYISQDNGEVLWKDMQLPFTISGATATRLAKMTLERGRLMKTLNMPCKLTALRCQAGDVVLVNNTRFGFSGKAFEVVALSFATDYSKGQPTLGVDLTLRETSSTVWNWTTADETTSTAALSTTVYDPSVVGTPTGLSLATASVLQNDGTYSPRLEVDWTAPADQFILSGGFAEIEYKKSSDVAWIVWSEGVRGDQTKDFINDVQTGISYDVRMRFRNVTGVVGSFCAPVSYTPSVDVTAPSTPTGLTAVATANGVTLKWNANTEPDLAAYDVYRNTVNSFPGGTPAQSLFGTTWTDMDVGASTVYYYWLKARDFSGNVSGATSSVNNTPGGGGGGGFIDPPYFTAEPIGNPDNTGSGFDELHIWANVSGQILHYRRQGSSSAFTTVVLTSPLSWAIILTTAPKYAFMWEAYLTDGSGGQSAVTAASYNTCN